MRRSQNPAAVFGIAVSFLFAFAGLGQQTVQTPSTAAGDYNLAASGANFRLWQNVTPFYTNRAGQIVGITNSVTELATGLNHLVGGQWVPSSENIQITPNGGAATNGQHEVYFAADINSINAVQITTPDGLRLNTHIMGLSYFDASTSNNVLFAELTNSTGQLVTSNQVVYSNAFTDCDADVRYTYKRSGVEQDIIVEQQLPTPDQYGLNPSTTWLQVWTEFINPPAPTVTPIANGADVRLDFGMMHMEWGRAFVMGNESNSIPVNKQWRTVQGRTFLIEQVPFANVATQLQDLPPASPGGGGGNAFLRVPYQGFPKHLPPLPKLAKQGHNTLKLAQASSSKPKGLVLDYVTLNTDTTGYIFHGDTTYYISGTLSLNGSTIIEGGTVIKFADGNSMSVDGGITCQTAPYRMAIFTSMNDNSVGQSITGSTGHPTAGASDVYLANCFGVTLQNLRFAYAYIGVQAIETVNIWNSQFVDCENGVELGGAGFDQELFLHNVLFGGGNTAVFNDGGVSLTAEQVTSDCANFTEGGSFLSSVALTNCLIEGALNFSTYSSTSNAFPTGTVFQTVGAGNYYLVDGSPYRNAGTTNISPTTLAWLAQKTTYPPLWLTNIITSDTILYPQATRDYDTPDLGYHYDPIDYLTACIVTNATLTLTNGVVLGYFTNFCTWLQNNSQLISQGTPNQRNYLVYYNLAQEQTNTVGGASYCLGGSLAIAPYHTNLSQNPSVYLRLTTVCAPVSASFCVYLGSQWAVVNCSMRDCEIYGGGSSIEDADSASGDTLSFENNVFQYTSLLAYCKGQFDSHNNLFRGDNEVVDLENDGSSPFTNQDNVCDASATTYFDGTIGWNAYINMNTNNIYNTILTNDIVTNMSWVSGPLGNFYQAANSPLINKGSTTADQLGLYHYTVTTNEVTETNSIVDIGYHYVALGANGLPLDSNGDGIPDYLEDVNGNGIVDNGEIDWQAPSSGINGAAGIMVFTPLK